MMTVHSGPHIQEVLKPTSLTRQLRHGSKCLSFRTSRVWPPLFMLLGHRSARTHVQSHRSDRACWYRWSDNAELSSPMAMVPMGPQGTVCLQHGLAGS